MGRSAAVVGEVGLVRNDMQSVREFVARHQWHSGLDVHHLFCITLPENIGGSGPAGRPRVVFSTLYLLTNLNRSRAAAIDNTYKIVVGKFNMFVCGVWDLWGRFHLAFFSLRLILQKWHFGRSLFYLIPVLFSYLISCTTRKSLTRKNYKE